MQAVRDRERDTGREKEMANGLFVYKFISKKEKEKMPVKIHYMLNTNPDRHLPPLPPFPSHHPLPYP